MTHVAIVGAAGRMGRVLVRCAKGVKDLRVVAAIEQAGNPALGHDAGAVAGIEPTGVAIADSLRAAAAADVLIDFSFHTAVAANLQAAVELRKAVVLGTTGLSDAEAAAVRAAAKSIPLLWAPNMSLGVNLLFMLVAKVAAALGTDYDVEIVETHHRHKKDAPSGTALKLGEQVAAGRKQDFKTVTDYGRHGIVGERPKGQIAIHALRGGDVVGDHTVVFANDGELIELSHRATSRDAFAMGALRAACWLKGKPAGLYDMQNVLGLA